MAKEKFRRDKFGSRGFEAELNVSLKELIEDPRDIVSGIRDTRANPGYGGHPGKPNRYPRLRVSLGELMPPSLKRLLASSPKGKR